MTQVSANATGNPFQSSSGELDGSTITSLAPVRVLVALISVAAGLSLALALRAPLATTVLGLIAFGVLHNVLEIRYVAGRFAGLLTGRGGLAVVGHRGRTIDQYSWPSRRLGGVVTQRPAKPFTPVRFRQAPSAHTSRLPLGSAVCGPSR